MRHTFLVVTVKKRLKSVYIYRKIKTGVSFLDHSVYVSAENIACRNTLIFLRVERDISQWTLLGWHRCSAGSV